jgi:hypothetical protein
MRQPLKFLVQIKVIQSINDKSSEEDIIKSVSNVMEIKADLKAAGLQRDKTSL